MDIFTRLAPGIYMRQHRPREHHPQAQHAPRSQPKRLEDLRDEELHRMIARTNNSVAEAKAKYESLRKQRQALRDSLQELSAKMHSQGEQIANWEKCQGACLGEKRAREKSREERRGERRREQRGREPGNQNPRRG